MNINYKMLKEKSLCSDGYAWFLETFGKDDVDFDEVVKQAKPDWQRWLKDKFPVQRKIEKKELSLKFIWGLRCNLLAEGDKLRAEGSKLRAEGNKLLADGSKLRAEGDKLWAEGNKLLAEGDKLWAEGNKLWAEGNKLRAEGDKLWAEGILEVYGNITLEWNYVSSKNDYSCTLETGEVFKP